jgi:hypothetical protein
VLTLYESGDADFKCDICDQIFSRKGGLSEHVKSKHEKKKRFFCKYNCDYATYFKSTLEGHMKSRHGIVGKYGCDYCDKSFINKSTFHGHLKRVHNITVKSQQLNKN